MSSIFDYSLALVGLAIFGYTLEDTFYYHRKGTKPYKVTNSLDRNFSYVTQALMIISYFWIFFIPISQNPDINSGINSFLEVFINGIENFIEVGFLSEEEVINYVKNILLSLYIFTPFAIFYLSIQSLTLFLGLAFMLLDSNAILVTFVDNEIEPKEYKRIITETNDFFYFEKINDFRNWEALRKDRVQNVQNIYSKSKFDTIILHYFNKLDKKRSYVHKNLKYATIILYLFLLAITAILMFEDVVLLRKILLYIIPVAVILFLVVNALNKK